MKRSFVLLPFYIILLNLFLTALGISGAVFYVVHVKDGRNERILEIRDSASGRVYRRWSLEEGGEFAIEFIHSVNQSPVRESFAIEGGTIRLTALRFYSYGAGIPSQLEEGWTLGRDGDAMLISGFNTSMREINYIIGSIVDHQLFINGEIISLGKLVGINTHETNAHITISLR